MIIFLMPGLVDLENQISSTSMINISLVVLLELGVDISNKSMVKLSLVMMLRDFVIWFKLLHAPSLMVNSSCLVSVKEYSGEVCLTHLEGPSSNLLLPVTVDLHYYFYHYSYFINFIYVLYYLMDDIEIQLIFIICQ